MNLMLNTTGNIIKHYPSVFKGLRELESEYKINLKHKPTPFALTVPRKVPLSFLEKTMLKVD